MDLKKKFEAAKTKIKENAPTVIAGAFTAVTVVLAYATYRLNSELIDANEELDRRCDSPKSETHFHCDDKAERRLAEGETLNLVNPYENFDVTVQKKERPEED